jgi:oligosaccharyltransferase complex subunit gamma
MVFVTLALGTVSFFTLFGKYVMPVLRNKNVWAGICLSMILLFTSGHMYNHIRKVPYVVGNRRGGIDYFAPGFQTQFGLESQIVAAMCEWPGSYLRRAPHHGGRDVLICDQMGYFPLPRSLLR